MKYKVELPGRFYDCGEESIVYFDLQTGDTHLVSVFTAHIIRLLAKHAMDTLALTASLTPDIAKDDLEDLSAALPTILDELLSLEIVEQV